MNLTVIENIAIVLLCLFVASCGNYDMGYEDGYEGSEKEKWILFGKTKYENGYLNGKFDAWCNMLKKTNYDTYETRCLKEFSLKPKIEP